jgi:predicted nuclease of predicted toxin-antitoxin system
MKVKLDENLPAQLAARLRDLGHDVDTVHDERLIGVGDMELLRAALTESRFLITQDLDFSDSRRFAPGSHPGILLIRLRSPNRRSLVRRTLELFQTEAVNNWHGCFVVATERKIRVVRPRNKHIS